MSAASAGPLVVLIGPPGAGKSTVGAMLAERLGVGLRDTDADIEASQGVSVQDIFVSEGEPFFRDLEVTAVARALAEHDGVLSLGGGAVMREETQAALAGHRVVFLDVDLARAAARVGMNSGRPLLLGNVRGQLKTLMDARRPLYASVARHRVDTSGLAARQVAEQILELIEESA